MDDSKWMRKATLCEELFELGHQNKVYLTHYTLDLASRKPITEDILQEALEHLYRKVPVLRVCLRVKDSELWIREMDKCIIDFKIIDGGDLETIKDEVTLHTYDTEKGPLWCVRLVSLEKLSSHLSQSDFEGKDFTYNAALILGIHHSVADGTTNVKICRMLHKLLDDVMTGSNIDDKQQLGEFTGDEELSGIFDREKDKLKKDPELCSKIKKDLEEGAKVRPLTRHICNIPSDAVIMTRNVSLVIDKADTDAFYKRAKAEGVTLHSALTGVINEALIQLMKDYGMVQEEYVMRAGHDINIRKYYSGDTSLILGCHGPIFGYRYSFIAPRDMLQVFWDNVRRFHKTFRSDVSEGAVLTTAAYRLMKEDIRASMKDLFKTDGEPTYYYTISNMGNLTGILPEKSSKVVSVQKLTRFSSLRNGNSFMCIYIHTFRGQLNFSFAYSTKFLSHDFIKKLTERVHRSILTVCTI